MTLQCPKCHHSFFVASRRTQPSSNFFHMALMEFSRWTGEPFASAKLWLKNRHGPKIHVGTFTDDVFEIDRGYLPPEWPGQNYRDDDEVWFLKSESAYNRSEEGSLIDALIAECADRGVDIDDLLRDRATQRRTQDERYLKGID